LQSTRRFIDLRRSILACGLLLAFAGLLTAAAAAAGSKTTDKTTTTSTTAGRATTTVATLAARSTATRTARLRAQARAEKRWRRHIRRYRADTRHWQTVISGRPPARGKRRTLAASSPSRLRYLAHRWSHRAHRAWYRAKHPPYLSDWMCIHRYEGSWSDGGSPYYGGLQMDLSFQETYGGWLLRHRGTADHWSPLEQIWVAVRASHSRGFSPWPTTAAECGL
jgi:hypothetical protein